MRSALQTFLAVLALSRSAYAACSGCTSDCDVKAQGDETPIGSCSTFKGSITVTGEGVASLDLGSIQEIKGDLNINNCTNLASVTAGSLQTIDGTFTLLAVTRLSSLSMDSLSSCGKILFQTCPALTVLGTAITDCPDVTITDTNLGALTGLSLKSGGTLDINNNNYLNDVTMTGLKTLDTALNIEFNGKSTGKKLSASFPNLLWALNATFRDVNSISLPALVAVNGSLGFYNDTFSSLSVPNITTIGESLSIDDCSSVTNISFPALTSIGGTFQIANNTNLAVINGFGSLARIGGAIDFSGTFTNATLPSLKNVDGGFNLQTTQNFDCTEFQNDQNNGVIRGNDFTCKSAVSNPTTKGGDSGSSTTSGSGSSPSKKAAAPKTQISFGLVAIAAVLGFAIAL